MADQQNPTEQHQQETIYINPLDRMSLLHKITDLIPMLQAVQIVLRDSEKELKHEQLQGILITLSNALDLALNPRQ